MKLVRLDIARVALRLRKSFRHARCDRTSTENVVVRAQLADGTVGYGEGVPREYVTGETAGAAFEAIRARLGPALVGERWRSFESLAAFLAGPSLAGAAAGVPVAQCAIELALLDAGGKHFGRPAGVFLGSRASRWVRYGVGISAGSLDELRRRLRRYRRLGVRRIKLKLGTDEADVERVATARAVMGRGTTIGVDANGAWGVEEAIGTLRRIARYRVAFAEEPTTPGDLEALAAVATWSPVPITVDESLHDEVDAERLIARRACHSFNLRISKCGGLARCARLARLARRHGLAYAVGCHVGESGILSAAGRHLLLVLGDAEYAEGSYGTYLLAEDLTSPSVRFGWGGIALPLRGPGLGVRVDERRLVRHLVAQERVA